MLKRLVPLVRSQFSKYSTKIEQISVTSLENKNDSVEITVSGDKSSENGRFVVPLVWLRDHCRSELCYNEKTNQRKCNSIDILEKSIISGPSDVSVRDSDILVVDWKDGHQSHFSISDLIDKSTIQKSIDRSVDCIQPWDRESLGEIPRLDLNTLSYAEFCQKFVKHGMVIISGVECKAEATERLCREIAPIHDTYYGAFWVFSNESNEKLDEEYHEDTAYGNDGIGPHTDGTYFNQTPGIQVFHCLHPAKQGGDTVVVDGLKCAQMLKENDPEAYRILCSTKIDHHYLEGDNGSVLHSVAAEKTVIELDENDVIKQIRFNPYDRSPFRSLSISSSMTSSLKSVGMGDASWESARRTLAFYKAYSTFARICHSDSVALRVSLRPSDVIFLDNFRVFHARTPFQGYRQMAGCYLSRDNFLAKACPHLPENMRRFL